MPEVQTLFKQLSFAYYSAQKIFFAGKKEEIMYIKFKLNKIRFWTAFNI